MDNTLYAPPFLAADTEMGNLMREHNWSASALGDPATWQHSLRSTLNNLMTAAFPMFLFWGDDLTCFYNDAFRRSLGTEGKHPALGKNGRDVWPEIWDFIGPLVDKVMSTGKPVWFEDQLVPFYRNGKVEDSNWTFSYSPLANDNGETCGVHVICIETTEKVNLLRKLEESNALYAFAIEASELGTWDLNPITNKFLANARLKEWFGLQPAQEVALELAINAIAAKDRARVTAAIQAALQPSSGGIYDIEYTIINASTAQERIVKARGKALFDDQGQPLRFNGTLQDVTAEVMAREQNQKLAILVENSVDLMAILLPDGCNSYINSAGRAILGLDADTDVTTVPIADFHTPEQLAFVQTEILPNVMTKGKWAGEFAIRNGKTGEIIPLYNNCHRIDNERTGELIGVGTVMRDIRAEVNARQRLEDEVRKRTSELLMLNEELERKNKDLASFAFVSSHDLQEPLRKINTFISRIEEDAAGTLNDKAEGYFGKIKGSVSRMQTLINDLLSFSKTNTSDVQFEHTDLQSVLAEVMKEQANGASCTIDMTGLAGLPALRVIPFQIHQLFHNLVGNSIKFAQPGIPPKITVTSQQVTDAPTAGGRAPGPYYHIAFSDNGIGFEPQYSEKIFEVFQRLHNRDAYEGTGIGLAICKRIMQNHNGFITAHSEPGKGCTFSLYFPV